MNLKPFIVGAAAAVVVSAIIFGAGVAGVRVGHLTQPGDVLTWGLMVGTLCGWLGVRCIDPLMTWAHDAHPTIVIECPSPGCCVSITAVRQDDDAMARLTILATDHTLHGRTADR